MLSFLWKDYAMTGIWGFSNRSYEKIGAMNHFEKCDEKTPESLPKNDDD